MPACSVCFYLCVNMRLLALLLLKLVPSWDISHQLQGCCSILFFFKVLIPKLYFKKGGKKTKRLQLKQSYSFLEFNKSCVSVN